MLHLQDGSWVKDHSSYENDSVSRDENITEDGLGVVFYNTSAPHIGPKIYGHFRSYLNIDLKLENQACVQESIEAFILALAIELKRSYDDGMLFATDELKDRIKHLQIEYLQPKEPLKIK